LPNDLVGLADMPVVVNHWSGDSFLFYRFDTNTNPLNPPAYRLHVARLDFSNTYVVNASGLTFATAAQFGAVDPSNGVHVVVGDTVGVQYYDVSQMLDIMMYKDFSGQMLTNVYFEAAPTVSPVLTSHVWSSPTADLVHFVDGNIGSPINSTYDIPWSGDDEDPTMYHVQRVTFDWVP
jgi:hypothetical protein